MKSVKIEVQEIDNTYCIYINGYHAVTIPADNRDKRLFVHPEHGKSTAVKEKSHAN